MQIENYFHSKILKVTMTILDKYPELYKYLEEMSVTIPNEKNPKITLQALKSYYSSLNSLLNKYKLKPAVEGEEKKQAYVL